MVEADIINNYNDILITYYHIDEKSFEDFERMCCKCKSYRYQEYDNCMECCANCFNINFKPKEYLCEFCKGLMERYYQCAPKIDLFMSIDLGMEWTDYKIVL